MIFVGKYNDEIIAKVCFIECALSINHLSFKLPCIKKYILARRFVDHSIVKWMKSLTKSWFLIYVNDTDFETCN